MSRDAYSKYSLSPAFSGSKIIVPSNNYLSGEMKSHVYQGAGWYIPSERRWEMYNDHKYLPSMAKRDAIDFQKEEDYVSFVRKRDRPLAPNVTSYIPCGVPEWKINGHQRIDNTLLPFNQFTSSERFPRWDGPGYYGYYHEALDKHRAGEFRTLPAIRRCPGYPLICRDSCI